MIVDAQGKDYREVDRIIRESKENIEVINPSGQRFMGAALQNSNYSVTLNEPMSNLLFTGSCFY